MEALMKSHNLKLTGALHPLPQVQGVVQGIIQGQSTRGSAKQEEL